MWASRGYCWGWPIKWSKCFSRVLSRFAMIKALRLDQSSDQAACCLMICWPRQSEAKKALIAWSFALLAWWSVGLGQKVKQTELDRLMCWPRHKARQKGLDYLITLSFDLLASAKSLITWSFDLLALAKWQFLICWRRPKDQETKRLSHQSTAQKRLIEPFPMFSRVLDWSSLPGQTN